MPGICRFFLCRVTSDKTRRSRGGGWRGGGEVCLTAINVRDGNGNVQLNAWCLRSAMLVPLPSHPSPPTPPSTPLPPPPYSERHCGSALEGGEPRAGCSEMKSHQSLFETWMTSISNGWYSRWQILEYGSQVALTGSTGATLAAIRV